ncbi:MAG TPA: Wzz/FepE/Etk N-terminal domain-containing protein, partial [Flavobacteriales bacterium]|nr:Wzz/FepE/Etk N-terminal domain-containing protein [Flavobacteriales bacterium]
MSTPAADTIDLRSIFRKIQAKWWWFLITIPLALATGWAYVKTTPKKYDVGAVMLLGNKKRTGFSENSEFIKGTSYLSNSVDLEDNLAILTSNKILSSTTPRFRHHLLLHEVFPEEGAVCLSALLREIGQHGGAGDGPAHRDRSGSGSRNLPGKGGR